NPFGTYDAFDAHIDLELPSTQFGISVGDWVQGIVISLSAQGQPVGSITTSDFSTVGRKFIQSAVPFDHVDIRAPSAQANWVIQELILQTLVQWQSQGTGCAGSNGLVPNINCTGLPSLGTTFRLAVSNMPTSGGLCAMVLGFSDQVIPGFGTVPFDLTPF